MNSQEKAIKIRLDVLDILYKCQSGHPGGSLSCVEILLAQYDNVLRYDPKNPSWEKRDRFILSKGHACPTLYAILADKGFFDAEELSNLRQLNSILQGHPDMNKCPGVDASTGSLGQGMSMAIGFALAGKRAEEPFNVYVLIGDGEAQEGVVWEAAMSASHYKLNNLVVLMDYNGLQIDGTNEQVMNIEDIRAKFEAFGWDTLEVDGHNVYEITEALLKPKGEKPLFIKCLTVKGKGVSFMENQVGWHGKPMNSEQYYEAVSEVKR